MSLLIDTNVLIEFPYLNSQLSTLNFPDFARYSDITAVTPQEILHQ